MAMIDGVRTKQLKLIPDERGFLMEILRSDDEMFVQFGQVYVTVAFPGVVKAWHRHRKQYDNWVVLGGMAKIVLYDDREGSSTQGEINEFFLGSYNRMMVRIPPLIWHGFKCIGEKEVLILNCPSELYNYKEPDEQRLPAHDGPIPYDWSRKDG